MVITSKVATTISGVKIFPGTFNYPKVDHKDKTTAMQLRVLRDTMFLITFGEILEGDNVQEIDKGTVPSERDGDRDICERGISDEAADEGSRRSQIPKRRDSKNKGRSLRRKGSKKTPTLEVADISRDS